MIGSCAGGALRERLVVQGLWWRNIAFAEVLCKPLSLCHSLSYETSGHTVKAAFLSSYNNMDAAQLRSISTHGCTPTVTVPFCREK